MTSRRLLVAGLLAAASLAAPSAASAVDTTISWALNDTTVTTYGSAFTVGSSASGGDYRWAENVGKDTRISANNCSNFDPYGIVDIGAGDQSFKRIITAISGTCFRVRGRVLNNAGSTTTRLAVVRR